MKLSFKPRDLNGIFIYHTDKQTYYSDPFCKGGYIIATNEEGKTYFLYTLAIPFSILIGLILFTLKFSIAFSIIISLALIIIVFIIFRLSFINNKLIYEEKFVKPSVKTKVSTFSNKNSKSSILILSLLLFAMAAAILWNILENSYEGLILYIVIIINIIFIIAGVTTLIISIRKK